MMTYGYVFRLGQGERYEFRKGQFDKGRFVLRFRPRDSKKVTLVSVDDPSMDLG